MFETARTWKWTVIGRLDSLPLRGMQTQAFLNKNYEGINRNSEWIKSDKRELHLAFS